MPQGVIGHALPLPNADQSGYHAVTLPSGKTYFTAINFVELGDELLTLSETYEKANWPRLLPEPRILKKYVSEQLSDPSSSYYKAINLINGLTSFLFLAAAVGLFVRFLRFVINDKLSAAEDNFESARVFTDILGYFLAPFIITFTSAVVNQLMVSAKGKETNSNVELVIAIYSRSRNNLINPHNITFGFFALTEIITDLSSVAIYDRGYHDKINKIEAKIIKIFDKIDVRYDLCDGTGAASITQLPPSIIINKLRAVLLSEKFRYFINQIKYHINKNALKRAADHEYPAVLDYIRKIYFDPHVQIVLLDVIGKISSIKSAATPNVLLTPIQLTEGESMEPIAKSALNKYWNNPDIKKPFIHPYSIDLKELANWINLEMKLRFPGYMILMSPALVFSYMPAAVVCDQDIPGSSAGVYCTSTV